jgi:hypothetical protein
VAADAEPDVLARVANVLTIANLAPRRANLEKHGNDTVSIELEVGPIGHTTADMIRRKLSQLTCVTGVKMSISTRFA